MNKGQGALEYLLLIGGAVVIGSIVIVLLLSTSQASSGQTKSGLYTIQVKQLMVTNGAGYWKLDDTAYSDSSGKGNNGAGFGGATIVGDTTRGNVASFNGTSSYIKVNPTPAFSNMSQITIAAWIKFNASPSGTTQEVSQKWRGWTFGYNSTGWWLELYPSDTSGTGPCGNEYIACYTDPWSPQPGRWYHVASTYDGTTAKTYTNGTLLASHPEALDGKTIWNDPGTSIMAIGAGGWDDPPRVDGRYFNGQIDELIILNRALSDSEIKGLAGG
ncbi:MAG: class III signal peptide-containing protein [Candidatus Diapherotrites archaeon]|uniref:Class III signal peptide-containing protein n=1 Tax=Candidatus Iainarchaeum sp. TaxID=3101447 RepID=A0A8T3YKB0_9ARCH|nr:class III signal peptide-containing protein [Candidatus Diapherotrites archaeon]